MAMSPVAAEGMSGGEVMDEMLWFAERFESIGCGCRRSRTGCSVRCPKPMTRYKKRGFAR